MMWIVFKFDYLHLNILSLSLSPLLSFQSFLISLSLSLSLSTFHQNVYDVGMWHKAGLM